MWSHVQLRFLDFCDLNECLRIRILAVHKVRRESSFCIYSIFLLKIIVSQFPTLRMSGAVPPIFLFVFMAGTRKNLHVLIILLFVAI
jgi:hypothetical protein